MNKKLIKIISSIILISLLLAAYPFTLEKFFTRSTTSAISNEDKTINDVSTQTGYSKNDIKELLSGDEKWKNILSVETLKFFKKENITKKEISEIRMIIERVTFLLNEIIMTSINKKEEDFKKYKELLNRFDEKEALIILPQLKKEIGNLELSMDEYLFSLQLDLDIEMYLNNKKKYESLKIEKSLGLDIQKIITVQKLENKVLEILQKENDIKTNTNQETVKSITSQEDKKIDEPFKNPKVNIEDIKPKNPLDEITDEINSVNPLNPLN